MRLSTSTWLLLAALGGAVVFILRYRKSGETQTTVVDSIEEVVVTAQRIGDTVTRALLPRGIRNNNPGNIEWIESPASRWRGMIGKDGRYGIFDSAMNGIRAIGGELKASIRKGQTLEQAIYEWAPPSENDSAAYLAAVSRYAGVPPTSKLTAAAIPAVATAIIQRENGQQPYAFSDIEKWVNLA